MLDGLVSSYPYSNLLERSVNDREKKFFNIDHWNIYFLFQRVQDLRTATRLSRRVTASMKPSFLPQTVSTSEIFMKKESSKQRTESFRNSSIVLEATAGEKEYSGNFNLSVK